MQWYYQINNLTEGPVEDEAFRQLIREGKIGRQSLVTHELLDDRWLPLNQFPLFACLSPEASPADPAREEEARQNRLLMEQELLRQRKRMRLVAGAAVLVIAATVLLAVQVRKMVSHRELGITASCPVGSFDPFDRVLRQKLLMDRCAVTNCPGINRTAPAMYTYSNPKCPRGKYVNASGSITLLADGQRITGVCLAFSSIGNGRFSLGNPSVCSIFGKKLWKLFDGTEMPEPNYQKNKSDDAWARTGFSPELPRSGKFAFHEGKRTCGCWYEYTPNEMQTIFFLEPKDSKGNKARGS